MASSLGTLTLDLVTRIGAFVAPLTQAEAAAKKSAKGIADSANIIATAFEGLGGVVSGVIAGFSFGAIFTGFITETKAAELEQAQLSAVLKSTGQSAGYSRDQLNAMADAMEKVTTFSGGDVNQAQTALLAFTGIVGKEFPRALQAAADMAARTGGTIQQSAETIGRSLDVPSSGLAALSKQGFRFTEDQKKLVLAFESVGDVASAQGIILDALEATYGGAAVAARDTFGGALTGLQNVIAALLTGEGSLDGAKTAVEALTSVLSNPATKDAVDALAKAAVALSVIMATRLAASAAGVALAFAAGQAEAIRYQLALARMAGVSTTAAIGLTGLGVAARAASGAMALLGGPAGVAILAASAIAYYFATTEDADTSTSNLADKVDWLNRSFEGLTVNQARSALQDINQALNQAQLEAIDAESAVTQYQRLLKQFPDDARVQGWNESLVTAQGELDTAREKVAGLTGQIVELNGVLAKGVEIPASKAYTDLAAKLDEQILLADKKTDADKLQARISAGLIKGLKDGEGDLLVAKQKNLDKIEATVAADKKAAAAAASASKTAATAAAAAIKRGDDAITNYQRQIELIDETTSARNKASEATKLAFDIESGKLSGISEQQKDRLRDLAKELDTKKALVKANEDAAKLAAFEAGLRNDNQTVSRGFDAELAGAGEGDKFKERLKANLAIEEDFNKQRQDMYKRFADAKNAGDPNAEEQYKAETQLLEEALAERIILQEDYYNRLDEAQANWLDGVSSAWENYRDTASDYSGQAAEATTELLSAATAGTKDIITALISDSMSLSDAFKSLGLNMANAVVNALTEMAAKWVVVHALKMFGIGAETTATVTAEAAKTTAVVAAQTAQTGATLAATATTTAATTTAAATTLAAWLPAALVSSIGTFGAAAVVGGAALIAAFALLGGFKDGGYTGGGSPDEVMGVVHGKEFVFTAAQVSKIGVGNLETLAQTGALATPAPAMWTSGGAQSPATESRVSRAMSESVNMNNNMNVEVVDQNNSSVSAGMTEDGRLQIIIAAVEEKLVGGMAGGNKLSRAFETYYAAKRTPR